MQSRFPTALFVLLVGLTLVPHQAKAASPATGLASITPSNIVSLVVTDPARIRKHPKHQAFRAGMVASQWVPRAFVDPASPLADSKALEQIVSMRTVDGVAGAIVKFKVGALAPDTLRAYARESIGAGFSEGTEQGTAWFTLAPGQRAAFLPGNRLIVGPKNLLKSMLALESGTKSRSFWSHPHMRALAKRARRGKSLIWGVVRVTKNARAELNAGGKEAQAKLKGLTFRVLSGRETSVEFTAHAPNAAGAQAVSTQSNAEMDALIAGKPSLRLLGVAALIEQAKLKAMGSRAESRITLTHAQVGLLLRSGPMIVGILQGAKDPKR